ncbi:MAG: Eco57I restriction-modification methylase domain-containing protein, partial [Tepidisphaeraceae bacterium]
RQAHARATNFYEVDLVEALTASGDTDPNEAFRYWWLFFRDNAFAPLDGEHVCWLDRIATGSRDYAREVEAELKRRVFYEVVPQLADGFLEDRRFRLKDRSTPSDSELEQIREGTLALLYRILFLLYAESRDLLPVRESAYYQISVKKLKEEIADAAGIAETQADEKLAARYKRSGTALYDRLGELFAVMDGNDLKRNRGYNVPVYNGGLFRIEPQEDAADAREAAIARFLLEHKLPDVSLASALDRLSRVPDQKTFGLAFVDYKSLGVRQLGSIYEGLLEFRLKIADEDLPPVSEKGKRKATRLTASRGVKDRTGVKKGEPYLANDKAERKATGSYYTPDHIVQYIVEHTVGPVLDRKLESLRPAFREAEKSYHRHLANAEAAAAVAKSKYEREKAPATPEAQRALAASLAYEDHKDLVEKLFNLKVLDPAMGSGHFLVEAVDFLTDAILHFLNAFPANPVTAAMARTRASILESLAEQGIETDALLEKQLTDVHLIKRHVLKRCIYGVDLNPLATELAKVSLWLDAFTIGAPLSFLDHHVRVGNSLLGATVQQVQEALHESQMTLFGSRFAGLKLAAIGMAAIAAMPDATADQVKRSQREYRKASDALAPFKRILDAYLMQWFMPEDVVEAANKPRKSLDRKQEVQLSRRERRTSAQIAVDFLKAPDSKPFFEAPHDEEAQGEMKALAPPDRAVGQAVLSTARERRFFHWELEFPEAFYEPRPGTKQTIERMENPGFDSVIGNPPYDVLSEKETGQDLEALQAFIRGQPVYGPSVRGKNNFYKLFVCRTISLQKQDGRLGLITPMVILGDESSAEIRRLIFRNGAFASIEAFPQKDDPDRRVFPEAKLATVAFTTVRSDD